jgi:hypothetical protein
VGKRRLTEIGSQGAASVDRRGVNRMEELPPCYPSSDNLLEKPKSIADHGLSLKSEFGQISIGCFLVVVAKSSQGEREHESIHRSSPIQNEMNLSAKAKPSCCWGSGEGSDRALPPSVQ